MSDAREPDSAQATVISDARLEALEAIRDAAYRVVNDFKVMTGGGGNASALVSAEAMVALEAAVARA